MINQAKELIPAIQRAIQLGHELNGARNSFKIRTQGMNNVDVAMLYHEDPETQEARQNLVDHLSQFTKEQVAIIRAVMYTGRNDLGLLNQNEEEDPELEYDVEYQEHRRRLRTPPAELLRANSENVLNDPKDVAIDHMIQKGKFPQYLGDGLKILRLI